MDLNNLPEILSLEAITELVKYHDNPDGRIWAEVSNKLSSSQLSQVLDYVEKRNLERHKLKLSKLSPEDLQEYNDALHRAGAAFWARDFAYITFFDEYNIVTRSGKFSGPLESYFNRDDAWGGRTYQRLKRWQNRIANKEKFTYFSHPSPFCNFYPSNFELNSISFNSVFQYMVYCKAEQFRDRETMANVLHTSDIEKLREFNRDIKYFEKIVWEKVIGNFLINGIKEKFRQNIDLKDLLLSTKGTTLVMVDENDSTWGTACSLSDFRIKNRLSWKGKNLLGEILTELRIDLIGE